MLTHPTILMQAWHRQEDGWADGQNLWLSARLDQEGAIHTGSPLKARKGLSGGTLTARGSGLLSMELWLFTQKKVLPTHSKSLSEKHPFS